jgi:hypothetical protein
MGLRCFDGVQEKDADSIKQTAGHVLSFFQELNKIFYTRLLLQHWLYPERGSQPMFTKLAVFSTVEFAQFQLEMKKLLKKTESPLRCTVGYTRTHQCVMQINRNSAVSTPRK